MIRSGGISIVIVVHKNSNMDHPKSGESLKVFSIMKIFILSVYLMNFDKLFYIFDN